MGVSYNDFVSAVTNYYNIENGNITGDYSTINTWATTSKALFNEGIDNVNYIKYLERYPDVFNITRDVNGTVIDASIKNPIYYGNTSHYNEITGGSINSNSLPSVLGESTELTVSGITSVTSTTGKLSVKGGIGLTADTGVTAKGVVSTVGTAMLAVGVGATLGKVIGDGLYEANPDFWATGKLSSLSETDWNKFAVAVKDDLGTLVNKGALALWGVNGDTTTMYADENALAYMTWYLSSSGALSDKLQASGYNPIKDYSIKPSGLLTYPITPFTNNGLPFKTYTYAGSTRYVYLESDSPAYGVWGSYSVRDINFYVSKTPVTIRTTYSDGSPDRIVVYDTPFTIDDDVYYGVKLYDMGANWEYLIPNTNIPGIEAENVDLPSFYLIFFNNGLFNPPLEGITSNPNSTQFDPTGVGSVATALGALKNQYPDLWNNSIKRNTIQDDGSEDERTYVPIPIPKYNNPFDEQPTTGTPSQTEPSVSPETTPKDELDNVSDTNTKVPTSSDNPNTGGGNSPSIIFPTQQASSLWAIYNPTLSQLNSLGAWLWSTNFIDQILKIFNDPMQAIIGLHKVYASPNISGIGNIKVGYLDSGVSSNIVGNQYTYINCGTVSLREYYGNILDYSPYTTVQLYLPFIGIVSLDISDVSRSSITVKYGVDVLTGACLASVSVQRDNAGGVLYQYSGNCACQYPLSSGSYMGMVTGAISAIGSLSRGNIIGTGLSIAGMHTNIEHSGGFSGNAGAMGIKKPYLIISRPQSVMNDGFPSIQGYPSNYFTRLGDCSGFTQIAECHVENIPATDKELDKIKDLLKEGVIL